MAEGLNLTAEPEAYDVELYDEFSKYAALEAFQFLNGDKDHREEQKSKFLNGEISNPELDYPDLDLVKLKGIEANLLGQKSNLLVNETNEVVKQAYRWRLNATIAEVRLLIAAQTGDMRRFGRYNSYVFGDPSPEVFAYTLNSIQAKIAEALASPDPEIQQQAQQLDQLLPKLANPSILELPDEETFKLAQQQTKAELGDLINLPQTDGKLDATQIKDAFNQALAALRAEGWEVVIDEKSSRTAVSISQAEEKVYVPQSREATTAKVSGLVVHEIETHVARRLNGERSRLKLLGLGLDRYVRGEEGIATMREQVLGESLDDFSGLDGHLAIGLALGVDGQPRDFRQVFEILKAYKSLTNLLKGKSLEEAQGEASESAWKRCIRTFRGSDCQTPGACFTQDIVYREGNMGVWDIIKNNPEEMVRFNVGKYDPANARHLWVLEQLGISDTDLQQLEA